MDRYREFTQATGFSAKLYLNGVKAALLGETYSGKILFGFNTEETMAIASMSKVMTYLLLQEAVDDNRVSYEDMVYISAATAAQSASEDGEMPMTEGEYIRLSYLRDALLIASSNEAGEAIAEHIAGSLQKFTEMMNARASELRLNSAHFVNPHGLPDANREQNSMCAADMFRLSSYVLNQHPEVLRTTKMREIRILERGYVHETTNKLLGKMEGVDGLKTGFTNKAGYCLTATVAPDVNNAKNPRLTAIVMGTDSSDARAAKCQELIEYGLKWYRLPGAEAEAAISKD